ncbi:uncharacterized protein LOC112569462 isoform X2 [Pomacea canaliculata]|uniref:uncharacterized protein LOC112569462 isoform X2 n=1 Tax=Pomacea canaliculata TaxID=400727 RepID=UPI000D7276E3|nr:uncharacterized protein LOC112569462 isoform X2 [Pomacea canaliculata]
MKVVSNRKMRRKVIFTLLIVSWLNQSACSVNLTVDCGTRYVDEGKSLECDCNAGFIGADHITWPGRSNSSRLKILNITRADNGTVFTCLMASDKQSRTANFTLQVAYGPDDHHTSIHGPDPFITDGTKSLRLTCEATEVNPVPMYTWDGVTCTNNDTMQGLCVMKPQPPWDDGKEVECTARSHGNIGKKTCKLNLAYPPVKPPEILGYRVGEMLSNGDNLHCRVSGGKPLVKKVNFSCFSDPPHEDQQDTFHGSFVQSSVTIGAVDAGNYSMVCVCGALWDPSEELYTQTSNITVFVDSNNKGKLSGAFRIGITVALLAVLFAIIFVSIAAAAQVKWKERKKGLASTTESCQQSGISFQTPNTSSPDYEEVDEIEVQFKRKTENIEESTSKMLQGESEMKKDSFKKTLTVLKKGGMFESCDIFPSSQTSIDSEERMDENLTQSGIRQGREMQLSAEVDNYLYTEVVRPEEDDSSHRLNILTTTIAVENTCLSTRACVHRTADDYDNVIPLQSSVGSSSADKNATWNEEWNLYDKLKRP